MTGLLIRARRVGAPCPQWHDQEDREGYGLGFRTMTEEQARWVRKLRVDDELSWRRVSNEIGRAWDDPNIIASPYGSNQIAGMEACERAAGILGEDWNVPPWN